MRIIYWSSDVCSSDLPAADQRATGRAAAVGDRGDDTFGDARVERAAGIIIKEEQRLGALDDQIVGTHRDEIDADAVVPIMVDREFELGADAVIGGDEQRIGETRGLEIEQAAETAQNGVGAGPARGAAKRCQRLHPRVARGDRNACVGVAIGAVRSEEHTSELQSLMRISYAVFCLKKKKTPTT